MDKEQVLELIDELGARLEGPAEQVWAMALRYQLTAAIAWLLFGVGLIVAGGFLFRWRRHHEWDRVVGDIDKGATAGIGWGLVVVGVLVVVSNVHALVNIEYVTLRGFLP